MSAPRILVVEDDPNDEELTLRALRRARADAIIDVAHDGQQALDLLLPPDSELPGLVVLDIGLPRLSGIEVLERLRASPRTHQLPIVVFTSSDADRDRKACEQRGANQFVSKPIDFRRYMDCVSEFVRRWLP